MARPHAPFGIDIIEQYLPHRAPMRFLNRVITLEDNFLVAETGTAADAYFFQGHFPGMPIVPGVIITECLGQAGALLAAIRDDLVGDDSVLAFTGIENAKFRRMVKPNETLCVYVKIVKNRRTLYKFSGEAKVGDDLVASVDFSASLVPK